MRTCPFLDANLPRFPRTSYIQSFQNPHRSHLIWFKIYTVALYDSENTKRHLASRFIWRAICLCVDRDVALLHNDKNDSTYLFQPRLRKICFILSVHTHRGSNDTTFCVYISLLGRLVGAVWRMPRKPHKGSDTILRTRIKYSKMLPTLKYNVCESNGVNVRLE